MRIETEDRHSAPAKPRKFYKALYCQVIVGLVAGILLGHFWPDLGASLKPLGDGFVKLVKMMIAPVVFCTIVSGITSLNDTREIGKTLVKSMALFYALTALALIAGLIAVVVIEPGVGMHISPASLDQSVAARFSKKLAPLGAFGAMAFTVGRYGIGSIGSLGLLIVTFYVACVSFVVIVLGTLARLHGLSLWKVLRYFREELLIVLGTSSTEPVLPRVLQKLEKLGCKKGVAGLVLPMGYSFNLDGTAIYLTLASLFIAQACDIHLSVGQIAAMLGVMLLTSKGAAGVTGSGFVALVATLTVMPDLPVAGVALIVGIDRFMSEARALTSTMSNAVACVVVSIWEKACDREVLTRELAQNYANTERALEEDATPPTAAPAAGLQPVQLRGVR